MKKLNQTQKQVVTGGVNARDIVTADFFDMQVNVSPSEGLHIVGLEVHKLPATAILNY